MNPTPHTLNAEAQPECSLKGTQLDYVVTFDLMSFTFVRSMWALSRCICSTHFMDGGNVQIYMLLCNIHVHVQTNPRPHICIV